MAHNKQPVDDNKQKIVSRCDLKLAHKRQGSRIFRGLILRL